MSEKQVFGLANRETRRRETLRGSRHSQPTCVGEDTGQAEKQVDQEKLAGSPQREGRAAERHTRAVLSSTCSYLHPHVH